MPKYTDRPPKDARGPAFPIRRTPPSRPLVAIVTSDNLVGCATHWWKGRTIPCEAPDCEACREQMPWRWHGYFAALNPTTHEHFIFEMTAQAAEPFVEYFDHYDTLRGCMFEAVRIDRKPNGRVTIRCKPADLQKINLPPSPSLTKALSILWNLPPAAVHVAPPSPSTSTASDYRKRDAVPGPKQVIAEFATVGHPAAKTNSPPK